MSSNINGVYIVFCKQSISSVAWIRQKVEDSDCMHIVSSLYVTTGIPKVAQ